MPLSQRVYSRNIAGKREARGDPASTYKKSYAGDRKGRYCPGSWGEGKGRNQPGERGCGTVDFRGPIALLRKFWSICLAAEKKNTGGWWPGIASLIGGKVSIILDVTENKHSLPFGSRCR